MVLFLVAVEHWKKLNFLIDSTPLIILIYPSSISHKYHILNLIMVIIIVLSKADDSADPILTMTNVRESQLSAGFAGKSRNRGSLSPTPVVLFILGNMPIYFY